MRARDVVGRRIVAVRQQRTGTRWAGEGEAAREIEWTWEVLGFELDNGAVLVLHARETDFDNLVTARVVPASHRRREAGAKDGG